MTPPALARTPRGNPPHRKLPILPMIISVGCLAIIIAGTYYVTAPPEVDPTRRVRSNLQDPALMQAWEQIPDAPRGEPVRFSNPFDPREVFEFPPGTSRAEARDAVAEILKARALERDPSLAR
jgi:hypothetical protein